MMQRFAIYAVLALCLCLWNVPPGWAQKVTPVTTLISTASTGTSDALGVEFYNSVAFTVTMSSTGTVEFYVSGNGTDYAALSCFSSDDTSGTPVTSTTASGVYQCNVAATQKVRVSITANGGTITVEAQASSAVAKLKGGGGGGGGGAPTTATYIMQTANGGTSAEQALGSLATGCLGSATTTGVVSARTITGTSNEVSVANGDCSGNPTVSLPSSIDLGGKSSFEVPNGAAPTTDAFGEVAGDNDAWAASRGALQFFDGTANTYLLGTVASDVPGNGECPKWNTGGTITWETCAGGSGTVTNTGGNLTANSVVLGAGTVDAKVVAGITTNGTAQMVLGVDATTLGSLKLFGNTSGDATISPSAAAGTATAITIPAQSGTMVLGSVGTTDGTIPRSDGTGGSLLQSSSLTISDTDVVAGAAAVTFGSDPADAGRLRLSNNESICWEVATPGTDKCLTLNASDEFELNAPLNITGTAGALLLTGVTSPSAPGTAEQWYFYADSVDNLPKYIYNGESEQTFYTTANPQTTATTASANDNDTSIATTAYVQTELTALASDTITFTNKTIDCEATGNACTIVIQRGGDLVGVAGGTAGHVWDDDPLSTTCTAAAVTGTNQTYGVCTFPDSDGEYGRQIEVNLPTGWGGTMDADIWWKTTGTGNARFQVQTLCYATDAAGDAAYSNSTYVTAAAGTSGRLNKVNMASITTTGCDAGERMAIRFSRNRTEASDTLTAALDVRRVTFNMRVTQ